MDADAAEAEWYDVPLGDFGGAARLGLVLAALLHVCAEHLFAGHFLE